MSGADARFEDGAERPLALRADDAESLSVISALVQDAVLSVADMRLERRARRFALLLNRFRWEDSAAAARAGRPYERVRTIVVFEGVLGAATSGFDRDAGEMVLSLLSITFEPGDEGAGRVVLTLAGDGAVALDVECLDVALRDVTRPHAALSGKVPRHP